MKTGLSKSNIAFAEFAGLCRGRGLKATQQRFEIYSRLIASTKHPDAESVYIAIRKRMPSISFDTVYRTMRMFEKKGVISRICTCLDRARYDANMGRHYHFICGKCGMIKDFYSDDFDRIALPDMINEIGKTERVHIEVRGVCNNCKNRK